jgi:hypothetical protein
VAVVGGIYIMIQSKDDNPSYEGQEEYIRNLENRLAQEEQRSKLSELNAEIWAKNASQASWMIREMIKNRVIQKEIKDILTDVLEKLEPPMG